jgi:hypothetical protein
MGSAPHLDEILAAREKTDPIPRDKVIAWMASSDQEALGALYHSITDRRFTSRIEPSLTFDDYQSFARAYFGRCLREDPKGTWISSRYSAGWDLVGWIASLWKDKNAHKVALAEWKSWLADMYRQADADLRTCLVTATLEHLFEQRGMPKYFADWKADPTLSEAYAQAVEWVEHGGESPLGKEASH